MENRSFYGGEKKAYWIHQQGKKTHRDQLKEDIEFCLKYAPNFNSFIQQLKQMGYTIDPVRLSVKATGWKRSVRLSGIGYPDEVIRKRLEENLFSPDVLINWNAHRLYPPKELPLEGLSRRLEFSLEHAHDPSTLLVDTLFLLLITLFRIADEISEIVQLCTERAQTTKDIAYLVFPLLYHTGMRIGECLALNETDINRKDHIITVNKMLAVMDERLPDGSWAKRRFEIVDYLKGNGDEREVVITDDCLNIIDLVKQINKDNYIVSPVLFQGITESNVECKLYRLCQELNITKRSPHKWRKTYISHLLNNNVDPDFVREQVGHKDLQTTLNSYTYSTTKREKQIKRLEEVLSV